MNYVTMIFANNCQEFIFLVFSVQIKLIHFYLNFYCFFVNFGIYQLSSVM